MRRFHDRPLASPSSVQVSALKHPGLFRQLTQRAACNCDWSHHLIFDLRPNGNLSPSVPRVVRAVLVAVYMCERKWRRLCRDTDKSQLHTLNLPTAALIGNWCTWRR